MWQRAAGMAHHRTPLLKWLPTFPSSHSASATPPTYAALSSLTRPQSFARGRLERFAAQLQQRLQEQLGQHAAAVVGEAARHLLETSSAFLPEEGAAISGFNGRASAATVSAPQQRPTAELALRFAHDCRHLGCADAHCTLCAQNQR